mgnify:CR=1 FL=1
MENDAFVNALKAMGAHWYAGPAEAPWNIGRNTRLREHCWDAFMRIFVEIPSLAPDLTIAMAYKACNDAPAHGALPTTTVAGDEPNLVIGPTHLADTFIFAGAAAIHTT